MYSLCSSKPRRLLRRPAGVEKRRNGASGAVAAAAATPGAAREGGATETLTTGAAEAMVADESGRTPHRREDRAIETGIRTVDLPAETRMCRGIDVVADGGGPITTTDGDRSRLRGPPRWIPSLPDPGPSPPAAEAVEDPATDHRVRLPVAGRATTCGNLLPPAPEPGHTALAGALGHRPRRRSVGASLHRGADPGIAVDDPAGRDRRLPCRENLGRQAGALAPGGVTRTAEAGQRPRWMTVEPGAVVAGEDVR